MNGSNGFDIAVVGGGIVGLASAYKITLAHPDVRIAVLEKEEEVATHQTGRNSGVIHSGLYYQPGSSKARTCAKGRKELLAFAKRHKIPYDICGKIVVATHEKQRATLEMLFQNGVENEIEGLEEIGPDQIKEIEPYCEGIAAIRVPSAGIIDFAAVARKLADLVEKKNKDNRILTSHKVEGFDRHDFYTKVRTDQGPVAAKYVINCAGLQCDRVAEMDNVDPGMKIVPFRGDYYELTDEATTKIKGLIYPVPDPALPFLGVHFTRMIAGGIECGPNAVFSFKREGYGKTDFSLTDTLDALSYPGLWRMFFKYWKSGVGEYARAFSKKMFLRQLQKLVPSLQDSDIKPCRSGVRAQALERNGELIDDFRIERQANSIHVLNAPSPAATAALAIGDYVNEMATNYFKL
ncbi:MAG: L-2-hydroxyglutarate oxidase [Phycisphaerales bacterium]|nr:MAG: L-2-hydroxyglutarate oxidase [Phycisphaerales bacterium]